MTTPQDECREALDACPVCKGTGNAETKGRLCWQCQGDGVWPQKRQAAWHRTPAAPDASLIRELEAILIEAITIHEVLFNGDIRKAITIVKAHMEKSNG